MRSPRCKIVTWDPARAATCANSIAMNPPPTKMMSFGNCSSAMNWVLSFRYASPGIVSLAGVAPAPMRKYRAESFSPSISIVLRSMNLALPCKHWIPACSNDCSICFETGSVKVRLNRISSGQSISKSPLTVRLSIILCDQSIMSATPTSTFLGSQPRKSQVPPNG